MPKVFISHSWNDNDFARKIAADLKQDGAEIWIDYARLSAGDSLPDRISDALEWCDTLLLLWSESAAKSHWVKLEWQSALDLQKRIIPCIIGSYKRPVILLSYLYLEFDNYDIGYEGLVRALELKKNSKEKIKIKKPKAKPGTKQLHTLPAVSNEITPEYFKSTLSALDGDDKKVKFIDSVFKQNLAPWPRAELGQILARIGDPRPGVGIDAITGLPEILWCPIPGGTFQMGEGNDAPPVLLDPYLISRYPITQKQYKLFVEAGGYGEKSYWKHAESANYWEDGKFKGRWDDDWRTESARNSDPYDLDNHPAVGITWYEALAFCLWLDEQYKNLKRIKIWQDGQMVERALDNRLKLLLPSEAEWERAARGGHHYLYPWGSDEIDPSRANYSDTEISTPTAAGSFPAGENPYGLLDMSGNVWEWTRSKNKEYPYRADDGREKQDSSDDSRSLRGGSFYSSSSFLRCASRNGYHPDFRGWDYGFRVVLSPVSSSVL